MHKELKTHAEQEADAVLTNDHLLYFVSWNACNCFSGLRPIPIAVVGCIDNTGIGLNNEV
jgi:hypothetical protein